MLDAFKPHRAEALQRARTNTFCLILLTVLSYLLPLPSVPTAVKHALILLLGSGSAGMYPQKVYSWVCTIEAAVATIFIFNLVQSIYALKYPRTQPPSGSPSKSLKSANTPSTPNTRHPLKAFSSPPNKTSNQPQKPFTFSPTKSTITNPSASLSGGSSRAPHLAQSLVYPSTPADTPGRRSVKYAFLSSLDSPMGSSRSGGILSSSLSGSVGGPLGYSASGVASGGVSSSPSSPAVSASPTPMVAWRGRHMAADLGRPLDGLFLSRLAVNDDDDDGDGDNE